MLAWGPFTPSSSLKVTSVPIRNRSNAPRAASPISAALLVATGKSSRGMKHSDRIICTTRRTFYSALPLLPSLPANGFGQWRARVISLHSARSQLSQECCQTVGAAHFWRCVFLLNGNLYRADQPWCKRRPANLPPEAGKFVLRIFAGLAGGQCLELMIELPVYVEDNSVGSRRRFYAAPSSPPITGSLMLERPVSTRPA